METLKIDRTKCKTPKTYAGMRNVTVQTVYGWIKDKKVKSIEIDGMVFVYLG